MKYKIRKIDDKWMLLTPFNDRLFWEESFTDAIIRMDNHAGDNVASELVEA